MRWQVLIVLITIVVGYLIIGGLIFWALEHKPNPSKQPVENRGFNATKFIEMLTSFENASYPENLTSMLIDRLESLCQNSTDPTLALFCTNGSSRRIEQEEDGGGWNFATSIFFAMTVVTTIGYGNVVPSNSGSQAFCCFYAVVGIPLTLVMLWAVGEKLNRLASRFDQHITRRRPRMSRVGRSACIFLFGAIFFLFIPAAIFSAAQGWSFGISFYYGMITLLTIGFGDYVAGFGSTCVFYRLCVGIWIFLGLAWLAGFLSSIQEALQTIVKKVDEDPIVERIRRRSAASSKQDDVRDSKEDTNDVTLRQTSSFGLDPESPLKEMETTEVRTSGVVEANEKMAENQGLL